MPEPLEFPPLEGTELTSTAMIPPPVSEPPLPPPLPSGVRVTSTPSWNENFHTTTYSWPTGSGTVKDNSAIAAAHALLASLGVDLGHEHSRETPRRLVAMLQELTACATCNSACIKWKTFPNDGMDEMIVVEDIPFASLCNHHLLPFQGVAHIGYVPDDKIAGLSKFSRTVQHFARTLQVQERLTAQVGDYLNEKLVPKGIAVVLRAEHQCMTIRGSQAPGAQTITAYMRGVFKDHERTAKAEFMAHINGRSH